MFGNTGTASAGFTVGLTKTEAPKPAGTFLEKTNNVLYQAPAANQD